LRKLFFPLVLHIIHELIHGRKFLPYKVGIYRERETQKINNTITFESSYWVVSFRDYLTAEIV